jgi:integrase
MRIEGFGSTYQRGRKWWIRYSVRGKKVRESAETTKEKEAYQLLSRRFGEVKGGKFVGPTEEKVTFEDLRQGLMDDYARQGRRSIETAKLYFRHLATFFTGDRAVDITMARLQAYQTFRLQEQASRATVNRELALLHRALVLAWKAGRLSHVGVFPDRLEESAPREETIEVPEHEAIREHLPPDFADAFDFTYEVGWRKRAVLGLEWPAVKLEEGTVTLTADLAKNKRAQTVPLTAKLHEILTRRLECRRLDCPLVFHQDGRSMYTRWQHHWEKACAAAGLSGKRLHDTRRTVARDLTLLGEDRSMCKQITGHRTDIMFERYSRVKGALRGVAAAANKLAAYRATLSTERKVVPLTRAQG